MNFFVTPIFFVESVNNSVFAISDSDSSMC